MRKGEFDGNIVPLVTGDDMQRFRAELTEAQARHHFGVQDRAGSEPFLRDVTVQPHSLAAEKTPTEILEEQWDPSDEQSIQLR